jgi:uncharacterized protein HemX
MEQDKKSHGALTGSIIIIIILIIGGIYAWQQKVKNDLKLKELQEIQKIQMLQYQEISSLEEEIESLSQNIEVDLEEIE